MDKINTISDISKLIGNIGLKSDLKEYGNEFQLKLIKIIITDKAFAYKIIDILKSNYFSDIYIRRIYDVVRAYILEYNRSPSLDNVSIVLKDQVDDMKKYDSLIKKIGVLELFDREFVMDNTHKFCFQRHAVSEMEKVSNAIKLNEFDKAQNLAFELFKFNTNETTKIYSLKKDFDMVFDEDKLINPQPTIFPTFNDNMQGGPGAGKLVIAVAPSNFGKTNYLVATARKLNEEGKKVVLFTFEIGGAEIFRRHLAGLTNTKQAFVKDKKEEIIKLVGSDSLGEFVLVEEKATRARISTIVHNLNLLKSQGFTPDVILVDSLNQLKLPEGMRYEGDNRMFEYLAEELRDLAKEEMLPLHCVFQGNRSSFKTEVNDEQSIGKAIEPFQVADVLFFFSQTPEMIKRGVCNTNLLKNRLGKKNILLECKYDPDMCVFEEIGEINQELMMTEEQKHKVKNNMVSILGNLRNK